MVSSIMTSPLTAALRAVFLTAATLLGSVDVGVAQETAPRMSTGSQVEAQRETTPKAVVELFTSQGCSSCPPADALVGDLARRTDVIALTLPVDYWDYLGWKDTLAQPGFTARQRAYAHLRGDRQVYTPQIVVNGHRQSVGSDREGVERSVADAVMLPVEVTANASNGVVTIDVNGAAEQQAPAGVWVVPVRRTETVTINRGENRGRSVTYANVVRGFVRIGEWRGGHARFEVPLPTAQADGDGYVVLLQTAERTKPSVILGAAKSAGL